MTVAESSSGLSLNGETLVELFEVTVTDLNGNQSLVCLKNGASVTYQGKLYEGQAVQFSGYKRTSDGSNVRPQLSLFNPAGIYNTFAFQGLFEGAAVIRYNVLQSWLEADAPTQDIQFWRISYIKEMITNQHIAFELRALSDIPNQLIPARQYAPPDFPYVNNG